MIKWFWLENLTSHPGSDWILEKQVKNMDKVRFNNLFLALTMMNIQVSFLICLSAVYLMTLSLYLVSKHPVVVNQMVIDNNSVLHTNT
jgi:hypothetical protein